jgi:pimeloyl-ACP methyl ester carboxylesterase
MSITTVGNHLIHYEVLGRGEPLIFVHGWLGSWRYWWSSMQALSTMHRAFAFDLWGFGDSSKETDDYSVRSYVTMIDQFINQLGIMKPVTLIGHGMGAAAALKYTVMNPDSVSKLVTVALPINGTYMEPRLSDSSPDAVLKQLGKANSFSEVDSEVRKTDPTAMNMLASEIANMNLVADIANCPRPVLMVFGNDDSVVKPPDGEYYHLRRSGNNRFYVGLDACQHFPMLQEKAVFNRLILDFLHAQDLSDLAPKEYWQRRTR